MSTHDVQGRIYRIRGQQVMLDQDLAELYVVPTKSLNLAVRRNAIRFPEDFMFQLSSREAADLRFQFQAVSQLRFPATVFDPDHAKRVPKSRILAQDRKTLLGLRT
jgi:hypothetical protein